MALDASENPYVAEEGINGLDLSEYPYMSQKATKGVILVLGPSCVAGGVY